MNPSDTTPMPRLIVFDTTLRDGEQSPGASMSRDEKVRIAKILEKLRVDVIEAGFAIASQGDFDAIRAVAEQVKDSVVCSLARVQPKDIERAAEALAPARRKRIHTFVATSPLHMQRKLRMDAAQVLDAAVAAVRLARQHTDDVEFSCEDASRSEFDFLCRVTEAVIAAGAGTVNLPDTVGYGEPEEFGDLVGRLINSVPNADRAVFSVHCHNDLGLAVANSLAAVRRGARQVECTINGLGERAGNASLEEIVMAVRTRADRFGVDTGIDAKHIVPASQMVSTITGFAVQPNKAIVGANAFAHEAGIHQDGVLKWRETYEIMRAEDVGWHSNKLVLGKHSGRAALRARLDELGIAFDSVERFDEAFRRFKTLADKKREVFDADLQALAGGLLSGGQAEARYRFRSLKATAATDETPTAWVEFEVCGVVHRSSAEGNGAVDAVIKAIEAELGSGAELQRFSVNAISGDSEAQGTVTVRLQRDGRIVDGTGADTDIVVAAAKAYLQALNLLSAGVEDMDRAAGYGGV